MRVAALVLALVMSTHAYAFDSQKLDQAIGVFRSGTTAEGYIAHNADRVLANLAGHWIDTLDRYRHLFVD